MISQSNNEGEKTKESLEKRFVLKVFSTEEELIYFEREAAALFAM